MANKHQHTAGDTLGQMGNAIKKDARQTATDMRQAAGWTGNRARDITEKAESAVETAGRRIGVNTGDPNRRGD
jgi:hypothetical protein